MKVDDEHIQVAVVVEIAECAAAARMQFGHRWSRAIQHLLKFATAQIAKKKARSALYKLRVALAYLRINVSSDHKDIRSSVVVKVGESGSPRDEAVVDGQTGVNTDVLKLALSTLR